MDYVVYALAIGVGADDSGTIPSRPSRTPRPASARLQSLLTHLIFGLGLYAAGRVIGLLFY